MLFKFITLTIKMYFCDFSHHLKQKHRLSTLGKRALWEKSATSWYNYKLEIASSTFTQPFHMGSQLGNLGTEGCRYWSTALSVMKRNILRCQCRTRKEKQLKSLMNYPCSEQCGCFEDSSMNHVFGRQNPNARDLVLWKNIYDHIYHHNIHTRQTARSELNTI